MAAHQKTNYKTRRYKALRDMIKHDTELNSTAKLVGLAILSLCQDRGYANPTNKKLVPIAGVNNVRTLQRATKTLDEKKYFKVTISPYYGSNRYDPNWDLVRNIEDGPDVGDDPVHQRTDAHDGKTIDGECVEVDSEDIPDERVVPLDPLQRLAEKARQRRQRNG